MTKRLFTSSIFGYILLAIIFIDLINSIIAITGYYEAPSVVVLRYLDLTFCLAAFVAFFVVTKYSLSLIRLFIAFKILLPAYMILKGLKDVLIYSYNRFTLEMYLSWGGAMVVGVVLYIFFNKYRVANS